jgi:plastocyanin
LLAALVLAPAPTAAAHVTPKPPVKVVVTEYEFGFRLSRTVVPPGRVTFVMRNNGAIIHNFDLIGIKVGPFLVTGQTARMTLNLKRGDYTYVCSVKYHAAQGMQGILSVR